MDASYSAAGHFFFGGSSVQDDGQGWGASSSSSSSSLPQNFQALPNEMMQLDKDENQESGVSTADYMEKDTVDSVLDGDQLKDALPIDNLGNHGFKPELEDFQDEEMDYFQDVDEDQDENENENEDEDEYEYSYDEESFVLHKEYELFSKFEDLPPGVEAEVPWLTTTKPDKPDPIEVEDEIDEKYKALKQFDTVQDYSDHHYAESKVAKPSKAWSKRIQHEWQLLENNLPGSIYVRVYEDTMDLLRAAIVGPCGTPYHDGLFFFDVHFPAEYPSSPPLVYYHSGGLRLNPNLYACGKVCLSLLGTWHGSGCEVWNASSSTMLQVLLSIQALILNKNPYYNEPGFEKTADTAHGQKCALKYNEETFVLSCRTMLYSLKKPPKHFDVLVSGHFRKHGHTILAACEAYMAGAIVGCDIEKWKQAGEESNKNSNFKNNLKMLFENLLMEFVVKGADCNKFLERKRKGERIEGEATSINHFKSQEEQSFAFSLGF